MGGGSLWDVGCYPVSFARRIAGEEPDGVSRPSPGSTSAASTGRSSASSASRAACSPSSTAASPRPTASGSRSSAATPAWSSTHPFLPEPDGPPPTLTLWRGRQATPLAVPSLDQYAAEVDDLTRAILDGEAPRVGLDFSRGTIATLVDLDRAARGTGV